MKRSHIILGAAAGIVIVAGLAFGLARHPGRLAGPAVATGSLPPANPLRNAYFGDLHLHTSYSFDAASARTNTTPEDSYRFALGQSVNYRGQMVQRRVPLDFLAVTDHAESLGDYPISAPPIRPLPEIDWDKLLNFGRQTRRQKLLSIFVASGFSGITPPDKAFLDDRTIRENWRREVDAAQKYYRPGRFTTFVAFEWSPFYSGAHMHRNVIFRGPNFPQRPFSALDSRKPEDLWAYAEANRRRGADSILIPHSSNMSDGLMFADRDSWGHPFTRAYAEARMRNERLVEITQNKGTSETRPELSPTDEFANFELYTDPGAPLSPGSLVRKALGRGLVEQQRLGINPFALGVVGGSDFHSGVSASEEFNYPGALGDADSQRYPNWVLRARPVTLSAGGLTGVWAERNTREALFDAMKRKEVFATTGVRMRLRLFAGFSYPAGITRQADWVKSAYAQGAPMGGDLVAAPGAKGSPRFLLQAVKDPDSGNLDRIQIVKVWYSGGTSHEKVFDAVWSGPRKPDPKTGVVPPVGDTVDLKTATYSNSIGAPILTGEWTDPTFDPGEPAIYYARAIEIPTPRWTTYLAVRSHLPLTRLAPPTLQERAWSSPVFYTPPHKG